MKHGFSMATTDFLVEERNLSLTSNEIKFDVNES